MTSIDDKELFEKYYQSSFDFNTADLNEDDIYEIKKLVIEKRVTYGTAPIGENIFEFISSQCLDIKFEKISFDSDKIDGLLYIKSTGKDKAYIVLNSNRPLVNQIFAAAHEYYHYLKDYASVKDKPYICSFSSLNSINEKKASRFAAEFLLPDLALKNEMVRHNILCKEIGYDVKSFEAYAGLCILLTRKYMMPLKAIMYRLYEEGYIKHINKFIDNYSFIKEILDQIRMKDDELKHLYSNENKFIDDESMTYKRMKKAFDNGLVSKEELISDAKKIGLNLDIINTFFDSLNDDVDDEDDDDIESFKFIQQNWGKKS